jgi:hypothetical protein
MIKVLMASLTILVTASVALAAYPANHPCLVTQRLDPLTGVVTTVAPEQKAASVGQDQRVASLAGGVTTVALEEKVASLGGGVTSIDPTSCSPSYFGAHDANRRIAPETGGGDAGAGSAGDGG